MSLDEAHAAIVAAQTAYDETRAALQRAQDAHMASTRALSEAQRAFDDEVKGLRSGAPRDSDWGGLNARKVKV